MNIHGIDWGGYDYALPARALYDAGIRFAVVKGGQPGTKRFLTDFRAVGCAVGCYYWNDPTVTPGLQINYFNNLIQSEQPDFIALDIEQYWSSWQEWNDYIYHGVPMKSFLTGANISANARAVRDGLKTANSDKFYLNYTADWFVNGWSPQLTTWIYEDAAWYASAFDYGKEWYDIEWTDILNTPGAAVPRLPPGAPGWAMWQYSSRMVAPGLSFPLDWNIFNGYLSELKGEQTMAGIHDVNVPMAQRAWVMEIKTNQKVNVGYQSLGVDAIILPMVGMPWDGNHQTVIAEPTFAGRFAEVNAAGVSVIGKVIIDASIVTTEQHSQPELDGHNVWQNLVVPKILDAWHIGPWSQSTLKPSDFRPIKAIIFEMTSGMDHQNPPREIVQFWQTHFFRYVVDKFRVLVQAGAVPNMPLILKSTPAWLQRYSVETGCAEWLYLALSEPKLESTAIMPDLWSIFKYAPGDEYKYSYVPDGYQKRVLLYEFTAGKQRMSFATGTAYLSKAFTDAARLATFLGESVVIPPVEPPLEKTIEERVTSLEQRVTALERG